MKHIDFPLTAKFNQQGRTSYKLVIGMDEIPESKGTPAQTVMVIAENSYGGGSRDIILNKPIEEIKSIIEEMREMNEELDFSSYCQKPASSEDKQKPQNGLWKVLQHFFLP